MPIRAVRMRLYPDCANEYKRRHDTIWPELVEALKAAGIEDYRIFLDEGTGALFAVMTHRDTHHLEKLPDLPVMRRWWAMMADIMDTQEDDMPIEIELTPMFSLNDREHDAGLRSYGYR